MVELPGWGLIVCSFPSGLWGTESEYYSCPSAEARAAVTRAQILKLQDRIVAAEAAHQASQARALKRRVLGMAAYLESDLANSLICNRSRVRNAHSDSIVGGRRAPVAQVPAGAARASD